MIDGLDPKEIERLTVENLAEAEADQSKLFPSEEDKLAQGVLVSCRIFGATVAIAAKLLGWERLIDGMAAKEGPILTEEARETADRVGIYGPTAIAARHLHDAVIAGSGLGPYEVEEESTERVVATCNHCPMVDAARESNLGDEAAGLKRYCTAAAGYETRALGDGVTFEFTHCLGQGDPVCRYVAEAAR